VTQHKAAGAQAQTNLADGIDPLRACLPRAPMADQVSVTVIAI
jgi:hypothetical protein